MVCWKMRATSQVARLVCFARCCANFEVARIFLLTLQKSSKCTFYPLSVPLPIAYCCHNTLIDMGT